MVIAQEAQKDHDDFFGAPTVTQVAKVDVVEDTEEQRRERRVREAMESADLEAERVREERRKKREAEEEADRLQQEAWERERAARRVALGDVTSSSSDAPASQEVCHREHCFRRSYPVLIVSPSAKQARFLFGCRKRSNQSDACC